MGTELGLRNDKAVVQIASLLSGWRPDHPLPFGSANAPNPLKCTFTVSDSRRKAPRPPSEHSTDQASCGLRSGRPSGYADLLLVLRVRLRAENVGENAIRTQR